ncbi:MAG: histidinol dehydrogenase [Thermodesulfovibrionales bacterium]
MSAMKTLRTRPEIESFLALLGRRARGADPGTEEAVRKILAGVRRGGDRALKRYTKRFDGHERLRVGPREIKRLADRADRGLVEALAFSAKRIRRFHERQREKSWSYTEGGITLGQIIRPIARAGVYVPGGKAAYPSTLLMNVIPAQVAGVREIAVAVPSPGGEVNPSVMAAARLLGVTEVYCVGGAQAVAALAYGTETVGKVDKIVGPGNIYVALAKRMVFGEVDIDMIAGPSEVLIIADSSAPPAYIAADLLSQAEHDELASPVLVTDSPALAEAVRGELRAQLAKLRRKAIARRSLARYGAAIIVKDLEEAARISNRIAPEHLEVMTRAPRKLLPLLENAGAIFLGPLSTEPLGDYAAGPNHTLPTGGTARFSSPLGVYDFMKRSSLLEFTQKGFMALAGTVEKVADQEGLEAHANAVRIRRPGRGR